MKLIWWKEKLRKLKSENMKVFEDLKVIFLRNANKLQNSIFNCWNLSYNQKITKKDDIALKPKLQIYKIRESSKKRVIRSLKKIGWPILVPNCITRDLFNKNKRFLFIFMNRRNERDCLSKIGWIESVISCMRKKHEE